MCGREASPKASPAQPSRVSSEHEDIMAGFHKASALRAEKIVYERMRVRNAAPCGRRAVPRMGR